MHRSVLVANRGEIAVRIIGTLRRLGIRAIAVFSDADAGAPHVRAADTAVRIGPAAPSASYLSIPALLDAARDTGAEAIHPGYGFLSESAAFARACAEAGITFVGPPPEAMEAMGDKIRAKQTVEAAGVPVLGGIHEPGLDDAALTAAAERIGAPLLVKAAAGGGGRGMRVVTDLADIGDALVSARREASRAFGDDALLLERWVESSRHIEVQVLADTHGHVMALGERECSLQRRHQKVIEEAPAPHLDDVVRTAMADAAVEAARACGYVGAGTVELIVPVDDPAAFAFLEMNTRLQVEHPVTEMVWGVDLVEAQLRVAAGEHLDLAPTPRGHAIEARVYAEDPARGFAPTGGTVARLDWPTGEGVRVDAGIEAGSVVGSDYDAMLAKVVAHGRDRAEAVARLDAALARTVLCGVGTNIALLRALLADADVVAGHMDTGMVERRLDALVGEADVQGALVAAACVLAWEAEPNAPGPREIFDEPGAWRVGEDAPTTVTLRAGEEPTDVRWWGRPPALTVAVGEGQPEDVRAEVDGDDLLVTRDGKSARWAWSRDDRVVWVSRGGVATGVRVEERLAVLSHADDLVAGGPLVAPMPGTVAAVKVAVGDAVAAGDVVVVVEAMKMEHAITATADGVVSELRVAAGDTVAMEQVLAVVDATGDAAAGDEAT